MITKLKDKFINFCRWVWSECKDVKTFLLLLVVIAVVYSSMYSCGTGLKLLSTCSLIGSRIRRRQ